MLCSDPESEVKKAARLQKKVLMVLNDLVVNDDCIKSEDKMYVRRTLGSSEVVLRTLLTDLQVSTDRDGREYILKILFRVH